MPSESEVRTWRCVHCKRQKGEMNRWQVLRIGPADGFPLTLRVRPFAEPLADDELAVCSKTCLIAEISAFVEQMEKEAHDL